MRIARTLAALSTLVCVGPLACSSTSATPAGPPLSNKDTAVLALKTLFVDKNTSAIDTYYDPAFIRHDPSAKADGTAAYKSEIASALPAIGWKSFRALSQGDLVVVHDEYDNLPGASAHTMGVDLFRFANGKIAEQWTCRQTDPGTYVNGHTMSDGPTASDPSVDTAASEDVVVTPGKGFVPVVIIGGAFPRLADFLTPTFTQHNPIMADGIMGVGAAFQQPPFSSARVMTIPHSVSENDFVFTRSRGTMTWDSQKANSPANPTVWCDFFRVQGGKIVEHWDVVQLDPNSSDIANVKTNGAGHTLWD